MASKGSHALVALGGKGAGGGVLSAHVPSAADMTLISRDFQRMHQMAKHAYAAVHTRTTAGGARVPAILTDKYGVGAGGYSVNFGAQLLHVASSLEDGQADTYLKIDSDGKEYLNLKVRTSEGPKAKLPPPHLGPPPTEKDLRSYQSVTLGLKAELGAKLDEVQVGDIVYLNGLNARAAAVQPRDAKGKPAGPGTEEWVIFLGVASIEASGFNMCHLWRAVSNLPTSELKPNKVPYIEDDPSSRYDRDHTEFLHVRLPPDDAGDDGDTSSIDESNRLMAIECGRTTLDMECLRATTANPTPFRSPANDRGPEGPRACLTFTHAQWPRGTAYSPGTMELVAVGINAYESILRVFGINDVNTWESLAPRIFANCPAAWFGFVDTRGTITAFGGLSASGPYKFALQLFPTGLIPDMVTLCKRIGCPVTSKFVRGCHEIPTIGAPGPASRATVRASPADIVSKLPPTVPVTGALADPGVTSLLLSMAEGQDAGVDSPRPRFYALLNIISSPANYEELRKLDETSGDLLATALLTKQKERLVDTKFLLPLYRNMQVNSEDPPMVCVVHAVCEDIIPPNVRGRNERDIMTLILGSSVPALAVTDDASASASASASAAEETTTTTTTKKTKKAKKVVMKKKKKAPPVVEEVSDEDEEEEEEDEDEEEEEEEERPPRKHSREESSTPAKSNKKMRVREEE